MTPTDLFSQRLRELREKKGLTQAELAAKLQISRKAISAYETGRAFPTAEGLEKMAKFFNVTVDYLLGLSSDPKAPIRIDLRYIPVYNSVCAGNPGAYPEGSTVVDYIPVPEKSTGQFAVRVRGDSMEPYICDGDYVVVDPNASIEDGAKVVVILEDPFPSAYVKILRVREGTVVLQSINPNYPPIVARKPAELRIVGKVVALHRRIS